MKKRIAFSVVLGLLLLLYGSEVLLAWKQGRVVAGHVQLFGITETREAVARRMGVSLSPNGRWYQWLDIDPPTNFAFGTYTNRDCIGFRELDGWPIHRTDQFGFFNADPERWSDAEVLIVGDLFVSAETVPYGVDITSRLNYRGVRTVNIGLTGSGPIFQLGALRAHWPQLSNSVKLIVWCYYEGNDLQDIQEERTVPAFIDAAFSTQVQPDPQRLSLVENREALFGPRYFAKSIASLKRLRCAVGLMRGSPTETAMLNRILATAQRDFCTNIVLIRIHKPGARMDRQWQALKCARKVEMPDDPALYSGRYPTAHYNRQGYTRLADLILEQYGQLEERTTPAP